MKTLAPHQQRVMDEKTELDTKLEKLQSFFSTEIFLTVDAAEQSRLRLQAKAMDVYSEILQQRINAF